MKWILLTTMFLFSGVILGAISEHIVLEKKMQTTVSSSYWSCCFAAGFGKSIETYNGYQYVIFYDAQLKVCVGRRAVMDTLWDTLQIEGFTAGIGDGAGFDGHNTPVLGICQGDGTIHLAFDHHVSPLHYSVSVKRLATVPDSFAWHGNLFGPVNSNPAEVSGYSPTVTYPNFLSVADGRLQLIFRENMGYDGPWRLFEYNPETETWISLGIFISGYSDIFTTSSAYFNNVFTYDRNNRLHATWCWRNTYGVNQNRDLCYAYSDDFGRTWYGSTGRLVGTVNSSPITADSTAVTVWSISPHRGYINSCGQAVDSKGCIHAVVWHLPDGAPDTDEFYPSNVRYFHYWREIDGAWHRNELSTVQVTYRPRLVFDKFDNLYLFTAQTTIYGASADSGWRDWTLLFDEKTDSGAPAGGEFHEPAIDMTCWESLGILSNVSASLKVTDISVSGLGAASEESSLSIEPEITIQPNPFNPSARISYSLTQNADVSLTLYNPQGKIVRKLTSGMESAGRHTVQVDAGGLASGIYICELKSNAIAKRVKLVLMR